MKSGLLKPIRRFRLWTSITLKSSPTSRRSTRAQPTSQESRLLCLCPPWVQSLCGAQKTMIEMEIVGTYTAALPAPKDAKRSTHLAQTKRAYALNALMSTNMMFAYSLDAKAVKQLKCGSE